MRYDAFISYRHLPFDKAVAERLQKLLENFKPPKSGSYKNTNKISRIFRDESELPTSSDLGEDIRTAIEQSRYLIVICSSKLKESKWCMQEIEYFKELHGGRTNHILPILIEGGPAVFPDALRYDTKTITLNDGSQQTVSVEVEPLASNITANGIGESLKKLNVEFLRIAAPLLGCSFDDLYGRHQRREKQRFLTAASVVMLVAGIFVSSVLFQNSLIQRERDIAVYNEQLAKMNEARAVENEQLAIENEEKAVANESRAIAGEEEAVRQAGIATDNQILAEENAREALRQAGIAQENELRAVAGEAEALLQKSIAEKNEAEANAQRAIAVENEAIARSQRNELALRQAKVYSDLSLQLTREDNYSGAGILALAALESSQQAGHVSSETLYALSNAAYGQSRLAWTGNMENRNPTYKKTLRFMGTWQNLGTAAAFNEDRTIGIFVSGSLVSVYDTQTYEVLTSYMVYREGSTVFEEMRDGELVGLTLPGIPTNRDKTKVLIPASTPIIIDANTGELLYEGILTREMFLDFVNETDEGYFTIANRIPEEQNLTINEEKNRIDIVNPATGFETWIGVTPGYLFENVFITPDYSRIIARLSANNRSYWQFYELETSLPQNEAILNFNKARENGLVTWDGKLNRFVYEFTANPSATHDGFRAGDKTGKWSEEGKLQIHKDGRLLHTLELNREELTRLRVSKDGTVLAACVNRYDLHFFDLNTGLLMFEKKFNVRTNLLLAGVTNEHYFINTDGFFYCYDLRDGSLIWQTPQDDIQLWRAGLSPDEKRIFWVSGHGDLVFLDAKTGQILVHKFHSALRAEQSHVHETFTQGGRYLFNETLNILFDAETGEIVAANLLPPLPYWAQPEGSTLIYIDDTYTLRIHPLDEIIARIQVFVRKFEFWPEDRRRYFLD
jgi:hypothetical protein